jgi:hypothetical protein
MMIVRLGLMYIIEIGRFEALMISVLLFQWLSETGGDGNDIDRREFGSLIFQGLVNPSRSINIVNQFLCFIMMTRVKGKW